MNILFCCEFYSPSVGGVQEVMKQIAERLVARGHKVTVATTALSNRSFATLNGVEIVEFHASGNLVRGMQGEINRYREFVKSFPCDAILIKAAQQWTFDALWPVLNQITVRKVFIPCGFLSFYQDEYQDYFRYLPEILCEFDALIFYSNDYRDINYARKHQLENCIVLSNGASETEFDVVPDPSFRARYGIPSDSFLILLNGSLTGAKGHLELAKAIALANNFDKSIYLILNGNNPYPASGESSADQYSSEAVNFIVNSSLKAFVSLKRYWNFVNKAIPLLIRRITQPLTLIQHVKLWRENRRLALLTQYDHVAEYVRIINSQNHTKRALLIDLPRSELIQAYLAADLFVFPSHVEYSPLVLFESAAAGTPFLSSSAGNARELVGWLGGGYIMTDSDSAEGFKIINPQQLAHEIAVLINQEPLLKKVGERMHQRWKESFTWDIIASQYEKVLLGDSC